MNDQAEIIKKFLERPVAYHPVVAKAFGSVKLAILWCQFFYWSSKTRNKEGWVYKTQEEIFGETALSRSEQEAARARGRELGVLDEKKDGWPAKTYYRVNFEASVQYLTHFIEHGKTKTLFFDPKTKVRKVGIKSLSAGFPHTAKPALCLQENRKQECGKPATSTILHRLPESTTESTAPLSFEEKIKAKVPEYAEVVKELAAKDYLSASRIHQIVVDEFLPYWFEKGEGKKRARWETEKVFDYRLRIRTWIRNTHSRQKDYRCRSEKWHRQGETCYCTPAEPAPKKKTLAEIAPEVRALGVRMRVTENV